MANPIMTPSLRSLRPVISSCLMLAGAGAALFLTGSREAEATAVFLVFAGVASLVARPSAAPRLLPVALGFLFLVLTLGVHLPLGTLPGAAWRVDFPENSIVSLGNSFAAMPGHALWWSALLGLTVIAGTVLLTIPLGGRQLAAFLHGVAFLAAAYAVVSIMDRHGGWAYPFSGDAVFGLLPNRNHTATLLVVGSVVSFGLMQWELTHGHRAAAAFAAVCGAPSLAALLFFSISRAGVLMLFAGFVIWLVGLARSPSNRRAVGISAAVLVIFLAGLFVLGGSAVRDRIADFWRQAMAAGAAQGTETTAIDFRQPIFQDTLRMLSDAPLTGAGLGHFAQAFAHYREASVRAAAVLHPESDWLMVAAECGWPAVVVLLALVAWFFLVCWRARDAEDGLLRWTVAAGVGAALLHGLIDVPWHRSALGWFLLVTALAAVPSRHPSMRSVLGWRVFQVLAGLALLCAGIYLAVQTASPRPPLPFRWAAYQAELTGLAKARKHDDGVVVAKEAIADFPLSYQSYYWYAAFLRTFLGTEQEMAEAAMLGRYVEPIHPRVASEQAQIWVDIDPANEAEARVEAVRRALRIDEVERVTQPASAAGEIRAAIEAAKDRPDVQLLIGRQLARAPLLGSFWLRWAAQKPAGEFLAETADLDAWLEQVPGKLRREVLERLVTLPDPSRAVAYMEARNSPPPGPYWRALARHYAAAGDKPAAVAKVAQAGGVDLATRGRGLNDFGSQLAELEAQGNDVAVRRLLSEAASPGQKDPNKLAVAMAWFAAAGDWENSWRAASRLASEIKIED